MKKVLCLLLFVFMFPCISISEEKGQFLREFAYIRLNKDNSVDMGPIFFGRQIYSIHSQKVQEVHLRKGESVSMSDGFHAHEKLVYNGVQDGKVVFEHSSSFFGMGRNSKKQWKENVLPYTKEEYAKGKEKEILDELLLNFDDYQPLYNDWIDDLIKNSQGREKEILNQIPFNQYNKERIAKLISVTKNQNDLLRRYKWDVDYLDFLLKNGADINSLDDNGETVLFSVTTIDKNEIRSWNTVSCSPKRELILFLLSRGINVNQKNKAGKTVSDILKENKNVCEQGPVLKGAFEEDCKCIPTLQKLLKGIDPEKVDEDTCRSLPDFEWIKKKEQVNYSYVEKEGCVLKCLSKNMYRDYYGNCQSCDTEYAPWTSKEECSKCPNRVIMMSHLGENVCALNPCPTGKIKNDKGECVEFIEEKCPPDKPMEKEGKCYPCEEGDNIFAKEECDKCPEFRKFENGLCSFTKSPYPNMPLIHVQEGYPIVDGKISGKEVDSFFFSCNDSSKIRVISPQNCAQCPNRKYENGECILSECPQGYFRGLRGDCFECSTIGVSETKDNYKIGKEECDRCPERVYKDGLCLLKECPKDAPIRKDVQCYYCDWLFMPGDVEESECLKCSNRKYENGECGFKE